MSDDDLEWRDYERVVEHIYGTLGRASGIEVVCTGPSCKVPGKSGSKHQIDVLTSHSDGVHTYKTAIECKHWKKKVGKAPITKLAFILADAGIDKGIIVSKAGFTPDAVKVSKHENISLVELRTPLPDDWEGRIQHIHIDIHVEMPQIYGHEFVLPEGTDPSGFRGDALSTEIFVRSRDGGSKSIREITHDEVTRSGHNEGKELIHSLEYEDGTFLSIPSMRVDLPIKGLRFKSRIVTHVEEMTIRGRDHVAKVMYSLFEGRTFVLSPGGEVRGVI